ncbi:iron-sulfur cluster assembly scaffold protein [Lysinibacillus pakistanensis]|uniref:Iron-sulfur cluster assembly scaffold protein n=1 Tax=Lysinibacillus pakistanensis TaxID=759811 RepID=A0AAX3WXF9_9BACI|nr:iron-sulfur cluster assembly scaffold protein [Lysinibacillus pakistanensis]MDM5232010.1 iron-sulfur cluster assembly scaffold protein [Lysinibacillus pakistanensis]QGG50193.1 iron-sulfur cluster assembly scaffold protein [Lysinibacillus pakistanensis]WHY47536.1 iron-sulfur cluster assembly scaffold protein [Lysinibacillus pakistanensis]WHY52546.1 iron-sulfur cluster assembly scaffold protein [Lysinibacillus pakistanensis]
MYNSIIVDYFSNPRHSGELTDANMELKIGNSVCGDTIFMSVKVEDGEILDAKYKAYGCATSLATADIFAEFIINKSIEEIKQQPQHEIDKMLGELEPPQMHCLNILHELFEQIRSAA